MSSIDNVRLHYDKSVLREWDRLSRNPYEFEINRRYIDRYIKPGESVLDIGGGPGRYSIYLARRGCEVTLADLSPNNIEFARQKAFEENASLNTLVCDARFADKTITGTFDHVLLMGPLYHLLDESDRKAAVNASLSLLKPGGTLFAAFISANAGIIYYLREDPAAILHPESDGFFDCFQRDTAYQGPSFTDARFERICDVCPFMESFSLTTLHLLASEGIIAPFKHKLLEQAPEVMEKWIEYCLALCERKELLGYAEHLLYIGRKS